MKKAIGIFLTVLLAVGVIPFMGLAATAETEGDYTYEVANGRATVTGYVGAGGNITIPSTLGGAPVTTIGGQAFKDNNNITSATIPSGVTTIGQRAFHYCKKLASVSIPNSVTSIGEWAFSGCESLTSVTLPGGIRIISDGTFNNCFSLKSIIIPNGVTSIGYAAFAACKTLASVTISDSVESIGQNAFYGIDALKNVTIPKSVTSIGDRAFGNAYSGTVIWNFKVRCYKGTAGQAYAEDRGLAYDLIDGNSTDSFVRAFENFFQMIANLFVSRW